MATILLIDDDLSTLKLVGLTLKKEDHRVVTASAGEEGLNKAFAEPPDLIICDLMMPGLDGYEVCRRL
ncbi:MAG: response regulator transcription factor, partial [Anaerolineae bacterium]